MSDLRIIRGSDVRLYADNTPLFGVTALRAVKKQRYHEVYEYLSAEPCERVPQASGYEIELCVMAMFDRQLPEQPGFTLYAVDGLTKYRFVNCRVTGRKTELNGSRSVTEVFTIEADDLREQVGPDV